MSINSLAHFYVNQVDLIASTWSNLRKKKTEEEKNKFIKTNVFCSEKFTPVT